MKLPNDIKTCLFYGGSFDPPHYCHLTIPEKIRNQYGLDAIMFMPAGISPFKADKKQTSGLHRINMLNIGLFGNKHAFVSDLEINKVEKDNLPSWTVDTLKEVSKLNPNVLFYILLGSDLLNGFNKWKDYSFILSNYKIIISSRSGYDIGDWWKDKFSVFHNDCESSSTEIRKQIKNGQAPKFLHTKIYEYILENKLYFSGI